MPKLNLTPQYLLTREHDPPSKLQAGMQIDKALIVQGTTIAPNSIGIFSNCERIKYKDDLYFRETKDLIAIEA